MGVLQLLADDANVAILQQLKSEPTYPRRLAGLLGRKETKVVPRLKKMEHAGLVRGAWTRKEGKNVKVYKICTDKIEVVLGIEGVGVLLQPEGIRQAVLPPLYLPPKIERLPHFVGRKQELKLISSRLNFIVLEGIAGIGKTSLLQAYAVTLPRNLLFWHTFKETDSFDHVVNKLAIFLEELNFGDLMHYVNGSGKDDSAKLDLLTRGLSRNKCVLIFDDYQRQHDEKIDSLLQHLQRNSSKAKIIVVSRIRPSFLTNASDFTELKLEGLSQKEAVQLLRRRNVHLKNEQIANIYRKTSGHPLAMTLLGTILEHDFKASESLLSTPQIESLIDELLHSLTDNERDLLVALSAFRNPIPGECVIQVIKNRGIRYLLQSLQRKMILKQARDNYFLHEMIGETCYRLIDYPEQLHKKIGEWYLRRPGAQDALEGLYHLSKARDWVHVSEVLMEEFHDDRFRFVEKGFSRSLLNIVEPAPIKNLSPKLTCCLLCVQASAMAEIGNWRKATLLQISATRISMKLGDPNVQGCVYKTIGRNYLISGDLANAESNLLLSLKFFRQAGNMSSLRKLFLELARLYFAEGDIEQALRYLKPKETARNIIDAGRRGNRPGLS
jgi:ATP/maltotriose-dependent transcriptional regulator MalT